VSATWYTWLEQGRSGEAARGVTPQLQRVLDAVGSPALIATSTWDIVGWNRAATICFGDYDGMPPEQRNTLRFIFAPGARERMPDWESHARAVVASFRAQTARIGTTERAAVLVGELSRQSPEFAAMWSERDVAALGPGTKRLLREGRVITLDYSSFAVNGHPELHMIVYTASTAEDAGRLRELLARPD
jgi:hypothetical protein